MPAWTEKQIIGMEANQGTHFPKRDPSANNQAVAPDGALVQASLFGVLSKDWPRRASRSLLVLSHGIVNSLNFYCILR